MATGPVVRFDGWTLDVGAGELRRPGGRATRLQWQSLQVLLELLAEPGRLVTRDQLIARLWPAGVVVTYDTALNTAIRRLRLALEDHADAPRYIETIPKRGYRFIGEVGSPAEAPPAESTQAYVAPTGAAAPDGIDARRRARPASSRGVALAVAVLVGLLVALAAVRTLPPAETSAPTPGVAARVEPVPAAAVARERQARFLMQRRGPGDVARAREHFEAAIALHPRHARAWSGIASTWWLDVVEGRVGREAGLERLKRAADRALQIDPGTAEAHLRLASLGRLSGRREVYELHLRRAAEVAPSDPLVLAFQASDAADRGDFDQAAALQARALEADPLSLATRYNLAVALYVAGRSAEAREQFEAWLELNPGDRAGVELLLGHTMVLGGEFAAALDLAERAVDPVVRTQLRALALHGLGRAAEASAALEELRSAAAGRRAYLVAEVQAFRVEHDAAFASLRRAVASAGEPCRARDCWPLAWLDDLPLLEDLRTDPRWVGWTSTLAPAASG